MQNLINSHLKTSNIYVQRQIIRDNIARLKNHMAHPDFSKLIYQHRREYKKSLDSQTSLLKKLDKKIKVTEQTSFPFGGFASSN